MDKTFRISGVEERQAENLVTSFQGPMQQIHKLVYNKQNIGDGTRPGDRSVPHPCKYSEHGETLYCWQATKNHMTLLDLPQYGWKLHGRWETQLACCIHNGHLSQLSICMCIVIVVSRASGRSQCLQQEQLDSGLGWALCNKGSRLNITTVQSVNSLEENSRHWSRGRKREKEN